MSKQTSFFNNETSFRNIFQYNANTQINIPILPQIKITFAFYQPGYRSPIYRGKESPDSKEQHTG